MAEPRTALVTGASSGIGRATAVALGQLGWRVGLGARRAERLEETAQLVVEAGGEATSVLLDVADPASVDAWFDGCERTLGPVDVLVNNAGTAWAGAFERSSVEALRQTLDTNLLGPALATRRAIASLRARGAPGDLVFVSSDTTVHPRPWLATYGASKAGLEQLATVLALELEGSGIRSTAVRVGPTITEFGTDWDVDDFGALLEAWRRYGFHRHDGYLDADAVAAAIVAAVTLPPGVHHPIVEVQAVAPTAP